MTAITARQWFSSCGLQVASIVFVLIIVGVALNSPKFLAATNPHFTNAGRDDTAKTPAMPSAVRAKDSATKPTAPKSIETEETSAEESETAEEASEQTEETATEAEGSTEAAEPKKKDRLRIAILNSGEFRNFNDHFQTFVSDFLAPMHEYGDVDMFLCSEISPPPDSETGKGLRSLLDQGLLKHLFENQQHAVNQFHRMELCYDWAKKTTGDFYKTTQDMSYYTHIIRTRPDFHYVGPALDLRLVDSSKLNIRIRGMRFQPPAWKDVAMTDAHMSWLYDNPHRCWDPPCSNDCLQQPFCFVVDDACAVMNSTIAESYFRFHSQGQVADTDENRPCEFAGGWPEWVFTRYQLTMLGGYKTLLGDAAGAMIWPLPLNVRLRDPKHAGWCGGTRCCYTGCPEPTAKICDRVHPW